MRIRNGVRDRKGNYNLIRAEYSELNLHADTDDAVAVEPPHRCRRPTRCRRSGSRGCDPTTPTPGAVAVAAVRGNIDSISRASPTDLM
ncbi:hypothetical protein RIF29_15305 [Crotalaria pallida]|uniref:Uncharacterized protein n=1 Tax=Crotalaria pallida TaxID=3830 RepID=A0AAN9IDG9_CROPI